MRLHGVRLVTQQVGSGVFRHLEALRVGGRFFLVLPPPMIPLRYALAQGRQPPAQRLGAPAGWPRFALHGGLLAPVGLCLQWSAAGGVA